MARRDVFIIGDSISIHYGPYLKKYISNNYNYDRKRGLEVALKDLDNPVGANAGDSRMVLQYLKEEQEKETKYDVLLINCGAHDIRVERKSKKIQVPLKEYMDNLTKIIEIAKTISNEVVWVSSCPIVDKIHNARKVGFLRYEEDNFIYNKAAKEIMAKQGVKVIDLYGFTKILGQDIYLDHIHFKEGTRKLQAAFIAGYLNCIK